MSRQLVEPLDTAIDHVRGAAAGPVLLEYGDYECPYSAAAYRAIRHVAEELEFRFVFRHFPLTEIHPHALAAAGAAEAASLQGQFWEMHDWLFRNQTTLTDHDLRTAAVELGLDMARFDSDRASDPVLERLRRDVTGGLASGEVRGTPTLFIDGVVHRGGYDGATLREALAS
jgi:protein-disulfide isomerase